jgi:hypothetical protein
VQTDYVYETEAEFEADRDSIPVGATVIKLYEYPDNLAGFMVVPDYSAEQNINLTNGLVWNVTGSGWLRYRIYINEDQGDTYIDLLINGSSKTVNGGHNTDKKYISDMVQVSKGDTVSIRATNSSGLVTTSVFATYFIPPKFIKKELPVVVEKNGSYSLEEVRTAETWIDGKPIYRKTLYFPALSNMPEVTQDVSGLNVDMFITMNGMFYNNTSVNPIPYVDNSMTGMVALLYRLPTKVIAIKNPDIDLSGRFAYVTLTYTKTTD